MSNSSRNLHENHRARVRKRFEHEGLKTFADHNVLELLLFYSIPQKDTNDIAHRLLDEFGSLSAVFDAPKDVLMNVVGVGENTATLIKLMPELFSRYEQDKIKNESIVLNSAEAAGKYFMSRFIGANTEKLYAVCLDNNCKVKKFVEVSEGNPDYTDLNMRKLVSEAINTNSSSVIISHNHPSGVAAPSAADVDATRALILMLKKLGIKVNDHIIVAGKNYFSMATSRKFEYLFM